MGNEEFGRLWATSNGVEVREITGPEGSVFWLSMPNTMRDVLRPHLGRELFDTEGAACRTLGYTVRFIQAAVPPLATG